MLALTPLRWLDIPRVLSILVWNWWTGAGIGDSNNIVTLSAIDFDGGSALGNPVVFGGLTGSLETGISLTDSSFVNLFTEQFAPGLALSFTLTLTNNDNPNGIPDGLTIFLVDASGVPLPTMAPAGDYFLTSALESGGPVFDAYGSDQSRAPYVGNPVSIPAPTISAVSSVPEPPTVYLIGAGFLALAASRKKWSGNHGSGARKHRPRSTAQRVPG